MKNLVLSPTPSAEAQEACEKADGTSSQIEFASPVKRDVTSPDNDEDANEDKQCTTAHRLVQDPTTMFNEMNVNIPLEESAFKDLK